MEERQEMTEIDYIKLELRNLILNLRISRASCPDDWDPCDERILDLLKRIYSLLFESRKVGKHEV